jgi:hypothetical protein
MSKDKKSIAISEKTKKKWGISDNELRQDRFTKKTDKYAEYFD